MSGGRVTLAIYIAIGCIPFIVGPAGGQLAPDKTIKTVTMPVTSSEHAKVITAVPMPAAKPAPADRGWVPGIMPDAAETVVIKYGNGGRVDEHTLRFGAYRRAGSNVEVRGPCLSACTIVLTYVAPERLCIAVGAYMAFHAVRRIGPGGAHEILPLETKFYYLQLPPKIRDWIDRHGGHEHLLLDGFWTMYDYELWAMGYPKCSGAG